LILGALQLLVGVGVFARNQFARWTGVVILSLNAIAQLRMIPAYPFWSLAIFRGRHRRAVRPDRLRQANHG
jgi:hypothetical protein